MNHVDPTARQRAEKIARSYDTPRFLKLDRLERYAAGTQYEGRPSWWNDDVPLRDRAPCVRAPLVERSIRGHVDLCLGDGRFPRLTTAASEDDFDDDLGLSADESRVIDGFLGSLVEHARLVRVSSDLMERGLESGSAVSLAAVRNGRLVVDTTRAKLCTPKFDGDGNVVWFEIKYAYVEDIKLGDGSWTCEARLFRRVIDEQRDITYLPVKASEEGKEPDAWIEDPEKTVTHGLGFCPVAWWRRERSCTLQTEIDGSAPHQNLLAEIDGLNFSLSQRHRAARYAGDPQIIETGVDEDAVRAPTGERARTAYAGENDHPRNRGIIIGPAGQPIRKRGPGSIWSYDSPDAKVQYLTLPAGALESLSGDVKDLYAMLRDALGYVDLDPANIRISADVSGKTIEWLHQNAVNFCNRLRPDFADGCLLPLVSLLLRLCVSVYNRGAALRIRGFARAVPIIARMEQDGEWTAPSIRAVWGAYFKPTEADNKSKQDRVIEAKDAGLITRQTAVEEIATIYPTIKDPAAYLDALDAENAKKAEASHAARSKLDDLGRDDETTEPAEKPETPDALSSMTTKKPEPAIIPKTPAAEQKPRPPRTPRTITRAPRAARA